MVPSRRVLSVCALALALVVPQLAHAATILAPGSVWQYTTCAPTGHGWTTALGTGNIGGCEWLEAPAPFGGQDPDWIPDATWDPNFFPPASWIWEPDGEIPDGDDLWVRIGVDLSGIDLAQAIWRLGVDNGYRLYLNGHLISEGTAEGFTYRWEYFGDFDGPGGAASLLRGLSGHDIIALALEDHGGLTAFDFAITVPEPATLGLFGLGAAALLARRRGRRRQ